MRANSAAWSRFRRVDLLSLRVDGGPGGGPSPYSATLADKVRGHITDFRTRQHRGLAHRPGGRLHRGGQGRHFDAAARNAGLRRRPSARCRLNYGDVESTGPSGGLLEIPELAGPRSMRPSSRAGVFRSRRRPYARASWSATTCSYSASRKSAQPPMESSTAVIDFYYPSVVGPGTERRACTTRYFPATSSRTSSTDLQKTFPSKEHRSTPGCPGCFKRAGAFLAFLPAQDPPFYLRSISISRQSG
jgi:hypothetical protein